MVDLPAYRLYLANKQIERLDMALAARAPVPFPEGCTPNLKGYAAEAFIKYQLLRRGLGFLEPRAQSEALDLVVIGSSGRYYRCEVKAYMDGRGANFYSTGSDRVAKPYTKDRLIDFFFVVDLAQELVAVVPLHVVEGRVAKAAISPNSFLYPFINGYQQFE